MGRAVVRVLFWIGLSGAIGGVIVGGYSMIAKALGFPEWTSTFSVILSLAIGLYFGSHSPPFGDGVTLEEGRVRVRQDGGTIQMIVGTGKHWFLPRQRVATFVADDDGVRSTHIAPRAGVLWIDGAIYHRYVGTMPQKADGGQGLVKIIPTPVRGYAVLELERGESDLVIGLPGEH